MINIIYESDDLIIADKPSFIPTAPLKSKSGSSFLEEAAAYFPQIMDVKGRQSWEGGLLHRLDTPTSGLVMFALNQKAFDDLLSQQLADSIIKQYKALFSVRRETLPGFPSYPFYDVSKEGGVISSSFRSYGPKGAQVRPLAAGDNKVYTTKTEPLDEHSVCCTITNGFRHQIRCHMAWAGYPLLGDTLYGGESSDVFGLRATGLSFAEPSTGKRVTISI